MLCFLLRGMRTKETRDDFGDGLLGEKKKRKKEKKRLQAGFGADAALVQDGLLQREGEKDLCSA